MSDESISSSPSASTSPPPMISVITIALNAAKTIGATLESVASQEDCDAQVEHVVVDGGSIDATLDVVRAYPHVRYISEPDHGIADAFNKGMHLASGKYLLYMNADDVLHDARVLHDTLAFVHDHHFPDWVVGNYRVRELDGSIHASRASFPPSCWSQMFRQRICHQTVFLQRAVLMEVGGFDTKMVASMDYELWARLCLRGYRLTNYDRLIAIYTEGGFSARFRQIGDQEKKAVQRKLRNTPLKRLIGGVYDRWKGK